MKFQVEWYETLSKACFECPNNTTDCNRPHCIYADGTPRSVLAVNRMMPGPAIEVCKDDTIVVDVENHLMGESTTIHWHGLHQRDSEFYINFTFNISSIALIDRSTLKFHFYSSLL